MINTKILIFDKNLLNISNIAMRYLLSLEKNCSNELFGGEKSSNIYWLSIKTSQRKQSFALEGKIYYAILP